MTVDAAQLGLGALRLFVERGLDGVTMDEVAVAGGVSRRTLFRVYPTKASIVWGGMDEFTAELGRQLAIATGHSVVAIVHSAWVAAMHSLDGSTEITRLRLKLMASSPEVMAWGLPKLTAASRFLEVQVARIEELPPDVLRVRLMASALMAAGIAGLLWWAQSDDPRTPAEVMDACFDELHDIFAAGETR